MHTHGTKNTSFFSKVTFLLHPNTGLNVYKKKNNTQFRNVISHLPLSRPSLPLYLPSSFTLMSSHQRTCSEGMTRWSKVRSIDSTQFKTKCSNIYYVIIKK